MLCIFAIFFSSQHIHETASPVHYFVSGAASRIDPSTTHRRSVPAEWQLFQMGDIRRKGGFAYAEATDESLTVAFHRRKKTSGTCIRLEYRRDHPSPSQQYELVIDTAAWNIMFLEELCSLLMLKIKAYLKWCFFSVSSIPSSMHFTAVQRRDDSTTITAWFGWKCRRTVVSWYSL